MPGVALALPRARTVPDVVVTTGVALLVSALIPIARESYGLAGLVEVIAPNLDRGLSGVVSIALTVACIASAAALPATMPRPIRSGAVAGTYAAAGILFALGLAGLLDGGTDARVLYDHRLPDPYDATYAQYGFAYTPVVAQVLYPFVQLPWQVFLGGWLALLVISLARLAGPGAPILAVAPLIALDLDYGNINLLLALAIARGLGSPGWWSIVLLTKVTPAVGIAWFLVRRQWRSFGLAVGTTAAIAAVSFLLAPGLWQDWLAMLTGAATVPGAPNAATLLPRLLVALAIVIAGAMTRRAWTVGVAGFLAVPVPWPTTGSLLTTLVPLTRRPQPGSRRRAVDRALERT
jgi:hypothetical protein